jgi:L-arabinonolactonase
VSAPEPEPVDWRVITEPTAELGEIPIWNAHDQRLYWIDIFRPALHRTDVVDGSTETWSLPVLGGSYVLLDDDSGVVIALEDGIHRMDLPSGELHKLADAPYDMADFRFNDGRCDPAGRFWVGTLRRPGSSQPVGSGWFYKFDGRTITPEVPGVTSANGIAYSPDGTTMYMTDRHHERLLAYDFDVAAGTATGERVFTEIEPDVTPDGAAVDTDGNYWIAFWKSGVIRKYSPAGELVRQLALPTSQPTMCAFGGPDLSTLFVTTSRFDMSEEQLAAQPLAGAVLAADVGATGLPEPRFPVASLA